MTWTKLGAEFSDDCAAVDLSDAAVRTHLEIIQWLYDRESMDLSLAKHRALKVAESSSAEAAFRELIGVGFWKETERRYELVHHADVIRQSLAAQSKKRERDKKAQQTHRNKVSVSADVSADVSDVVSGDTDRQTDKHLGGTDSELTQVRETACEHGLRWGCRDCLRKETA